MNEWMCDWTDVLLERWLFGVMGDLMDFDWMDGWLFGWIDG
jgi:hypothetical protein